MDVSAILVPIASAVLSVLAALLSVGANNRKLRAEAQAIDVQSLRETLGAVMLCNNGLKADMEQLKTRLTALEEERLELLDGINRLISQLERHRITPEWRPGQRHSSRKREVKL